MDYDYDLYIRHLQAIKEAGTFAEIRAVTVEALNCMGFTGVYFISPVGGDRRVTGNLYFDAIPPVWERHYRSTLQHLDPLPRLSMAALKPVVWPDAVDNSVLDARQRRYMALAKQFGLARGVGISSYGSLGRVGFLGAIYPQDAPWPLSDVVIFRVQTLGQHSFLRFCALHGPDENVPALSNRELEVLQWVAQGKSNPVIAEILGIALSSVNIYVKRIFAKLDVTDRTSASVRAVSLGLWISPDQRPRGSDEGKE